MTKLGGIEHDLLLEAFPVVLDRFVTAASLQFIVEFWEKEELYRPMVFGSAPSSLKGETLDYGIRLVNSYG